MNKKADRIKRKLIKEVVIPSLLGVLIALLFLLAVVKLQEQVKTALVQ